MSGRILFLTGLTSTGKSCTARCLAALSPQPLYQSSNDTFHGMIPGRFFAADFWRAVAETIGAQYYAVRGMAEAGFSAVIDGMGLDLDEYEAVFGLRHAELVREIFRDLDVFFVRFDCPPEELRRRNLVRGDRGEFQSEEQAKFLTRPFPADLVIDAAATFPDEAALKILTAAGMPADPGLFAPKADGFRAEMLREILTPLNAAVNPALEEDAGLRKIPLASDRFPRAPGLCTETDVCLRSPSDTEAVLRELSSRGYRRLPDSAAGPLLARGSDNGLTEFCRILRTPADDLTPYLGQTVTVSVDRPAGSAHPGHPDLIYPIPYGFLPDTTAGDGAPVDAYCVGFENGETLTGEVRAVIRRNDDREQKLIVVPKGAELPDAALADAVRFTERYFLSTMLCKN